MDPFEKEIVPGFTSVREKGLNMIDASELHYIKPPPPLSHLSRLSAFDESEKTPPQVKGRFD